MTEFTMVMNGKTVKGEVLEKDKAREIYEGIVARMQDPALLEFVGTRLFKARVFPLPARGTAQISLTYVEHLAREGGVVEYRYPLKTRPYNPAPVGTVGVHVSVKSDSEIKTVFSSSHQVDKARKNPKHVDVSFEQKQHDADRDFYLFYTLSNREFGLHLLSDGADEKGGYFLMTLAPKQEFAKDEVQPKDIVFVVDTSGSMREHEKMAQAKKALSYGLKGLSPRDRFNVVSFSTEARAFGSGVISATPEAVGRAIGFVDDLEAVGGTNIHDALLEGFEKLGQADDGRVRLVVFLTDGLPTVGETRLESIVKAVAKRNASHARVFVFGVGYDVNTQLLDRIAEGNRGSRDYVTPGQNLELKLSSFFDKVAYPVFSDLSVSIDGVETFDVYPKRIPDLFKGSELTVLGRYKGAGTHAIRLSGQSGGKGRVFVFEGKFAEGKTERDFLSVLWARRKVGYLWDQIRLHGNNDELRQEIVRLGKKYAIATPYTSFLVVEDETVAQRRRVNRRLGRRSAVTPGSPPPPPTESKARREHRARNDADIFFGESFGEADIASGTSVDTDVTGGAGEKDAERRRAGFAPTGGTASSSGVRAGGGGVRSRSGATVPGGIGRKKTGGKRRADGKNAVRESLEVLALKSADAGSLADSKDRAKGKAKLRVTRLEGRTFHLRHGVWVDTGLDAMKKEDAVKKLEVVEAFSKRYFELVRQEKWLAKCLAKMPLLMVKIGDGVVRFVAPVAKKETSEKTTTGSKEKPKTKEKKTPSSPDSSTLDSPIQRR